MTIYQDWEDLEIWESIQVTQMYNNFRHFVQISVRSFWGILEKKILTFLKNLPYWLTLMSHFSNKNVYIKSLVCPITKWSMFDLWSKSIPTCCSQPYFCTCVTGCNPVLCASYLILIFTFSYLIITIKTKFLFAKETVFMHPSIRLHPGSGINMAPPTWTIMMQQRISLLFLLL